MELEKIFTWIIDHVSDGVYIVDPDRKILFWNKAAEEITGYTAEEMMGCNCQHSGLNHVDMDGNHLCCSGCPLLATIHEGMRHDGKVFVLHKNGCRLPVKTQFFPISEKGKVIAAVEIFRLASQKVYDDDFIETLSGAAMHDQLTNLPNRRYLENFLKYKILESSKFKQKLCVAFGDIDHFRDFNNTYGHDAGDAVLQNIATSIRSNLKNEDKLCRWGGEEFVFAGFVRSGEDARALGERLRNLVMNTSIIHKGERLSATMSIGVTLLQPGDTTETLLKRADALMYQSKQGGRNRVTADC